MKKILIIDDKKDAGGFYGKLTIGSKFSLKIAQNATEALEILDNSYDLIIYDSDTLGSKGLAVLEQIKDRTGGTIPLIMIVDSYGEVKNKDLKNLGISDFLFKPLSIEALSLSVSRIFVMSWYE